MKFALEDAQQILPNVSVDTILRDIKDFDSQRHY
jgi:hypothetical protein